MSRLHFSVLLALRTFLNPIVFLAYLVFALGGRERGIVPAAGTNVSRMIPGYYAAFAATALVGCVWIDGMEGNIMGFFGFPILLLGALCSVAATAGAWLASLRP